jgi:hypothetical protein
LLEDLEVLDHPGEPVAGVAVVLARPIRMPPWPAYGVVSVAVPCGSSLTYSVIRPFGALRRRPGGPTGWCRQRADPGGVGRVIGDQGEGPGVVGLRVLQVEVAVGRSLLADRGGEGGGTRQVKPAGVPSQRGGSGSGESSTASACCAMGLASGCLFSNAMLSGASCPAPGEGQVVVAGHPTRPVPPVVASEYGSVGVSEGWYVEGGPCAKTGWT